MRSLLLQHLLPLVPFDGWSEHALSQAAQRAGIHTQELHRAFPSGVAACIDYFFASQDDALEAAFPPERLLRLRVPDRIETLILAQLEQFSAHREAVRRAIAHRALPWNAPGALGALYRTVDRMWRLAGDASIDFSFYTKRATLAGLYGSTVLYWLNDDSPSAENTKAFLKRGLAAIAAFGKKKKELVRKWSS